MENRGDGVKQLKWKFETAEGKITHKGNAGDAEKEEE